MRYQRGGSFWGDAGRWIKKNKVLSRGGQWLSGVVPGFGGTAIGAAAKFAGQHGYGRRTRRRAVYRIRRRIRRR